MSEEFIKQAWLAEFGDDSHVSLQCYTLAYKAGWNACAVKAQEIYAADEVVRENLMQTIHVSQVLRKQVVEEENARQQGFIEMAKFAKKTMKKIITSNVGCGDYKHNCAHFNALEFDKTVKKKYGIEI